MELPAKIHTSYPRRAYYSATLNKLFVITASIHTKLTGALSFQANESVLFQNLIFSPVDATFFDFDTPSLL